MLNQKEVRAAIASLEAKKRGVGFKFQMYKWLKHDEKDASPCGTAVCIAGDAVLRHFSWEEVREWSDLQLIGKAREIFGMHGFSRGSDLFVLSYWSAKNAEAYELADDKKDHIGMIDAAIAELKRFIVPDPQPTEAEISSVIARLELRDVIA